jgi:hypothetical protein
VEWRPSLANPDEVIAEFCGGRDGVAAVGGIADVESSLTA